MIDQTTQTEEPQAFDQQTADLITLVDSVNQFMSKKPSDPLEETQNESDVKTNDNMVIENEKEPFTIDVTKLTFKEKRQALRLMKERQLLNEFELAKKNEMICEQRLKHANFELENIKLSLELEIEESDRLKRLKSRRSQKKKKPSYSSSSSSSFSGSESGSSRSPSPDNKRKRSPSPIRKPRSRSRSKSPAKKVPSPKRLSRSKSPVIPKSRSPMSIEKEKPPIRSLSPRKRSLSPRKTNNTTRYENTRPKQQYENKRRRIDSPPSFRSSGEYYTRLSPPIHQRNDQSRGSYGYGRYSKMSEVPEIGYRARYDERRQFEPIPTYSEPRYSKETEKYDTYIPNSKSRINRERLTGDREVKSDEKTRNKERQFIETVQMPERKSAASSRNTTNEAKPNNEPLPQIQMNIPMDGEITRTIKYTPISIDKGYEEDEPCYDSD